MARHGRSRNLFEDFYPSAAEDEDNEETLDETIRQGVISSRMPINQAASDRDLGEDASEGWERTADDPLLALFTGEAKLLADINPDADPVNFFTTINFTPEYCSFNFKHSVFYCVCLSVIVQQQSPRQ